MKSSPLQEKLIAIGGVSRSGKSELASYLARQLSTEQSVVVLAQDDNCLPEDQLPLIRNRLDWESPNSMDWDSYHKTIQFHIEKGKTVIVEGIFVFDDPLYAGHYAKEVMLRIDYQTFLERRKLETRWGEEPRWFIEHVWQAYHKRTPAVSKEHLEISPLEKDSLRQILSYIQNP